MTCTTHGKGFEAQIDDYVDGLLPAEAAAALEAHLALCASCRMLAADLQAIRAAARALPAHRPPPHVWSAIAAALEAPPPHGLPGWLAAWQPLAAAAVILLIAGGLGLLGARLETAAPPAPARAAVGPDPIAAAAVQLAAEYSDQIAGLERLTAAEAAALDPDTAGVLQANLTVIDEAILESRTALERAPGSALARESLFDALRHKVTLLQYTLALINEMRKGNEEGAARIATGLDQ